MRAAVHRLTIFAIIALLFTTTNMMNSKGSIVHASAKVTIMLDGYPLPFPAEPVIIKGNTMVPFRAIAEAIGVQVQYNNKTKRITAIKQDELGSKRQVELQLGNSKAIVDGETHTLSVAPRTVNGHTLIPLSFFSRQFGAGVSWDGQTKTVTITSPKKSMYIKAYYALSSFSQRHHIPALDSVAFGWSRIDREGNFTSEGKEYKWPEPAGELTPESIIRDAAAAGTTPYLMVYATDGKGELTKIIESAELRKKTIEGIIGLALQKGFQGVHLDFEGLGLTGDKQKVREQFNEYVSMMSKQAKDAGLKLSLALHPPNSVYQGYDYRTLGVLADELVIMAYAYEDETRPEPMDKVDEAIRLALKDVDKSKLVLGISLWSETAQSVNQKIGLAKRYDLKGISFWRLGLMHDAVMNEIQKSIVFDYPVP
ncbi:stalk domain-containing protein [Paenibacillus tarimensis]